MLLPLIMREQIDNGGYAKELGRPVAVEYHILSRPAEIVANRVNADHITVCGAILGIVGSFLFGFPEDATQAVERLSRGHLKLSRRATRTIGIVALGTSYLFDLLDGAVARKSSRGETKHGVVLDGIVNKMVDTSPAIIAILRAKTLDEWTTWSLYKFLAPVSTIIRSVGLQYDIPIAKTGLGARIGRIPMIVSAMLFENRRSLFGKILVGQLIADSIHRYRQVVNSGNREAQAQVQQDLAEYSGLFLLGTALSPNHILREAVTTGLGFLKLAQVKIGEAYRHKDQPDT